MKTLTAFLTAVVLLGGVSIAEAQRGPGRDAIENAPADPPAQFGGGTNPSRNCQHVWTRTGPGSARSVGTLCSNGRGGVCLFSASRGVECGTPGQMSNRAEDDLRNNRNYRAQRERERERSRREEEARRRAEDEARQRRERQSGGLFCSQATWILCRRP